MLTAKQFSTLKKVSVGANLEKSSVRIPESFKNASTEQKAEIIKLSGLTKFVFYKASTSPKAILALACVLGISPFYLSGESDDKDCNDDIIKDFYDRCTASAKEKTVKSKTEASKEKSVKPTKAVKSGRKPSLKKTAEANTAKKTVVKESSRKAIKDVPSQKPTPTVNAAKTYKIDEESLGALLKSLSIRAKFGGEAKKTYDAVIELLIK